MMVAEPAEEDTFSSGILEWQDFFNMELSPASTPSPPWAPHPPGPRLYPLCPWQPPPLLCTFKNMVEIHAEKIKNNLCFHFKRILKIPAKPKPGGHIKDIFSEYSENGIMTIGHLHRFLTDYQKDSHATKEDAQNIFNGFKHINIVPRRGLNLDAFFQYLLSDLNTPLPSKAHHDMDAPLSHYFLHAACQNLTENELRRACTVDITVKDLKRGVRVIELNVRPNSSRTGMDVCVGGTVTTPVELKKCLRAIKDNAFVASEYPLLINFEDLQTLDPDLQDQVARMVTKTFGDMLYYPDYSDRFPSPSILKKKILILIEPPTVYLESQESSDGIMETIEEEVSPELRKLIAIHTMKMKGPFGRRPTLNIDSKRKRLSISRQQLEDAIATDEEGITMIRFTTWNILSVHPKDQCFGSISNYDPYTAWLHGAQIVPCNLQVTEKYLSIMQGLFRANGGCGYVKKPNFVLTDDVSNYWVEPTVRHTLKIKIYNGQGWHLDPYNGFHFPSEYLLIKIRINGVPGDEMKALSNPVLFLGPLKAELPSAVAGPESEFNLRFPELAVLRIKVLHCRMFPTKYEFAGQTSLPISELKSGIRAVPLYDKNGDRYRHRRLLVGFNNPKPKRKVYTC